MLRRPGILQNLLSFCQLVFLLQQKIALSGETLSGFLLRRRVHQSLGVVSLVSVSAPTEVSDLTVKDAFYAKLESVVDQLPRRDTLLILWNFNALTGTDKDDYETCVGPHESATVKQNSTKFLDFARSHGLRVAGSSLDLVVRRCGKGD